MKILILSSKVPYPPKDGGAIATLNLAEGLADDNHQITMLCLNTSKHPYNIEDIDSDLSNKIKFHAINHDTSIKVLDLIINYIASMEPYNAIRFFSKEYEEKLIEILIKEKPDVVQLEGQYMGYYIPAIRKNSEAKVSLRAHNVESEIWERKSRQTNNPFTKFYLNKLSRRIEMLENKIIVASDMLVAISDKDKTNLVKFFDIPSITIPTGLNPDDYPAPKKPEFPSLFFIGALDWMPNQEGITWFINEVFLKLKQDLPSLKLHIAGRNAPEWLENKFQAHEKSGIVYHGEVDDAYEFMNKYAIFVSPLFTGSGIRIKILEGMMMKRAIIATSIAIEGISASDQENIFISDKPEDIRTTIINLCENERKYDEIGENSRHFVIENFNTLATSKKLSDFYRTNRP